MDQKPQQQNPPQTPIVPPQLPIKPVKRNLWIMTTVIFALLFLFMTYQYVSYRASINVAKTLKKEAYVTSTQPSPTKIITPTPDPTMNWKMYTDSSYHFSIKYPPTRKVQALAGFGPPSPNGQPPKSFAFINKEHSLTPTPGNIPVHPVLEVFVYSSTKTEFENTIEDLEAKKASSNPGGVKFTTINQEKAVEIGDKDYYGKPTLEILTFHNGWTYDFTANEDDFSLLKTMLSTFRFLDQGLPESYLREIEKLPTYTNEAFNFQVKYPTYLEPNNISSSEVRFVKKNSKAEVAEYRITVNKSLYNFDDLYAASDNTKITDRLFKLSNTSIDGEVAVAYLYFTHGYANTSSDDIAGYLVKKGQNIIEITTQREFTGLDTSMFLAGFSFL